MILTMKAVATAMVPLKRNPTVSVDDDQRMASGGDDGDDMMGCRP
eukprot:CAMPEP_0171044462 /NCGR_PEP_ID=MMETSP0736-20130129/47790_1 /TAXON_ID=186038 /ORGANISM="Fragilariopsis kerguelensis, Strain L26-C5" /LENGTH=44 /DNA_ID= /DNA_START= /DNA_END= /DNA_ORIENTATION=